MPVTQPRKALCKECGEEMTFKNKGKKSRYEVEQLCPLCTAKKEGKI
ncbi:MAG: hypothetical protein WC444_05665 [Candidatus Paceibacterota bacterium]